MKKKLLDMEEEKTKIKMTEIKKNKWFDKNYCLQVIKENSYNNLKYVKEQDEEIVMEALNNNPFAFKYATFQNKKICLQAIKGSYLNLKYVKEQDEEIVMEALKKDNFAFKYAKFQNEKICLQAVKSDPFNLEYVKEQTEKIVMEAIKKNQFALCKINKKEIYNKIIKKIKYLKINTDYFNYYKLYFNNGDYKIITEQDLLFNNYENVVKLEKSNYDLKGCPLFVGNIIIDNKGYSYNDNEYHYDDNNCKIILNSSCLYYADKPKIKIKNGTDKFVCQKCKTRPKQDNVYTEGYYLNQNRKLCIEYQFYCFNCWKQNNIILEVEVENSNSSKFVDN